MCRVDDAGKAAHGVATVFGLYTGVGNFRSGRWAELSK